MLSIFEWLNFSPFLHLSLFGTKDFADMLYFIALDLILCFGGSAIFIKQLEIAPEGGQSGQNSTTKHLIITALFSFIIGFLGYYFANVLFGISLSLFAMLALFDMRYLLVPFCYRGAF